VEDIIALGKIQLWIHRIESGKIVAFQALKSFAEEVEINCTAFVKSFLSALLHLSELDITGWEDIAEL